MHLPFWLTTALLSPLLLYQGKRARRTTPRLPEGSGNPCGQYGEGAPARRILVLGESTAASVGVVTHDQGLASQLARQIHQRTGQTTAWHTFGINGIRMQALIAELDKTQLPAADNVLLSMGVNDTTGFTSRSRFCDQLLALRQLLAVRYPAPLILLSVPPMHLFTALPSPLRQIMGWRARQLDAVYARLAHEKPKDFVHLEYPLVTEPGLLAADGYHPGRSGYQQIAEALASSRTDLFR
ncbi:SGNH/GDSL hydrolase family protein [uncultured Halopseudomonas sp.]|uniref:SGNH/GDSL hydrolase family protein n=1 Tax=uncultured Halopseudomonas sp. TaxID=2901193 RepID=UPI0030ECC414|tara:strand:+ start:7441 stop:8160 length:720 start_codon:yes stop_codon:yes gene_type:complete